MDGARRPAKKAKLVIRSRQWLFEVLHQTCLHRKKVQSDAILQSYVQLSFPFALKMSDRTHVVKFCPVCDGTEFEVPRVKKLVCLNHSRPKFACGAGDAPVLLGSCLVRIIFLVFSSSLWNFLKKNIG